MTYMKYSSYSRALLNVKKKGAKTTPGRSSYIKQSCLSCIYRWVRPSVLYMSPKDLLDTNRRQLLDSSRLSWMSNQWTPAFHLLRQSGDARLKAGGLSRLYLYEVNMKSNG